MKFRIATYKWDSSKLYGIAISITFPYGEDGYMLGIPYRNLNGSNSRKRESITMREYYAYRLQQRFHEGKTLLLGRRLFQQFIMDAYTSIEEERLQ